MTINSSSPHSTRLVAVVGGGQLGRMLGFAGVDLGVECRFLDPTAEAPARAVGELVVGALDDAEAVARVAHAADVLTYEWEGVDPAAIRSIEAQLPVRPNVRALEVTRDRLLEKQTLRDLEIPVAEFAGVRSRAELSAALPAVGLPALLKTQFGGYDGKGQTRITSADDTDNAIKEFAGTALVVEQYIPFIRELSLIAVRSLTGETQFYPLVENLHHDGVLRITRAPALGISGEQQNQAQDYAERIFGTLDYVGVLAIELFETAGKLIVNELAPRVHNSGHWTIEGATCSQFENHLRAILGEPLGLAAAEGYSAMVNCLGEMPDKAAVATVANTYQHDYQKTPRAGRKMGHITITAATADQIEQRLDELKNAAPQLFVEIDGSANRTTGA